MNFFFPAIEIRLFYLDREYNTANIVFISTN